LVANVGRQTVSFSLFSRIAMDSGQARVWIWDVLQKNALREVSDINVRGDELVWSVDGKALFVTTVPRDLSAEDYAKMLFSGKAAGNDDDVRKTSGFQRYSVSGRLRLCQQSSNLRCPDPWNLDLYFRDLVSIEVSSGRITSIVHDERNSEVPAFS